MTGFLAALAQTMRDEAHMHRLWYDIRSQTLFETAFRADVAELDKSLEDMIWRIMRRFAELTGEPQSMPPSTIYAMIDGLFQQGLLKHYPAIRTQSIRCRPTSGWSFRRSRVPRSRRLELGGNSNLQINQERTAVKEDRAGARSSLKSLGAWSTCPRGPRLNGFAETNPSASGQAFGARSCAEPRLL